MEKYKIKLEFEEFTIKDETKKNDIKIYMTKGEKGDSGGIDKDVNDLTYYYTKDDTDTLLLEKANEDDIPTLVSQLENDEGFITGYIETDPIFSSSVANEITSNDITNWNNKSDFSGDYNDLTNKPVIPDVSNYVTKDTTQLENYTLTNDLSNVALSNDYNDLDNKPTLFSGDYEDLSNKPSIPTKTSDLTNDKEFIDKTVDDLTNYTKSSNLSSVAISGNYNDLSNKPSLFSGSYNDLSDKPNIPSKTSDLNNDSGFINNNVDNLTNYTKTSNLSNVATSGNYNDLTNKPTIPDVSNFITKDANDLTNYTLTVNLSPVATSGSYNDLSNTPTIPPTMTILSYGHSTWQDFLNAYNTNTIVYCRASSNSNPATGSQTRLGFMAYVNNADNPTNVEFQYYRSVSSHSATQQGDQVYVYKLDKTAGWTVTVREAYTKIAVGTGLKTSYSNGTLTISLDN